MAELQTIFGSGGLYKDLKGGGKGLTAQLDQISAGLKARPDIFVGSRKNVGRTQLAEGYSFTGGAGKQLVDTISYKGGSTYSGGTFNVYRDAPAAPEPTPAVEEPVDTPIATTLPVTNPEPTNPYQGQIDELTGQLGTISGQIGGYTDTIADLKGQIQTMQTGFGDQLREIMNANAASMKQMSDEYAASLKQQQEAQELARQQRELAAQTAAANQARAGQQADFQVGSGMMRGIFGGLAGFKRRGKAKLVSSDSLSIAGNGKKSPNKMLNV